MMRADRPGRTAPLRAAICLLAPLLALEASAVDPVHAGGMDELRERMRRLDALVFERTLSPLAIDRERSRRADEIALLAGELAAIAASLAKSGGIPSAGPARRERFVANARRLGEEAAALERAAAERQIDAIPVRIERLGHACAACHAEFRPAAGVGD